MRPVKVGTVWVRRPATHGSYRTVPVVVLGSSETDVVVTCELGTPRRNTLPNASFRFLYEPAPTGTPPPTVWPPAARPSDGWQITRLGDVPAGWWFREGWEAPDVHRTRRDDDRSYEGSIVECRPPEVAK